MSLSHVCVYAPAIVNAFESLHANPAHMGPAARASHVVAPAVLLHIRSTARTRLYTILLSPATERFVFSRYLVLELRASEALVVFDVARRAYAHEAGRTAEDSAVLVGPVNGLTVRRRTVAELLVSGLAVDMRQEYSFQKLFLLRRGQDGANNR